MLTSVGRAALRRLVSTAAATSSRRFSVLVARPATSRVAFRSQRPGFAWSSSPLARGFAARAAATKKTAGRTRRTATKGRKKTKKVAAKKTTAKPRKTLTPEQKAERKKKQEITSLKQAALFTEPKPLTSVSWPLYMKEQMTGIKAPRSEVNSRVTQLATQFRSLPDSELRRLQTQAEQNKLSNAAAYKAWVESHTPQQISEANRARRLLKKKYGIPKSASALKLIKDERQPKRLITPFAFFTKARWGSGDFNNRPLSEAVRDISAEWKGMSASQKQPYIDLGQADQERYSREVASTLGK